MNGYTFSEISLSLEARCAACPPVSSLDARAEAVTAYKRCMARKRLSQQRALANVVTGEEREMQHLDVEIAEFGRGTQDLPHLTGFEVMVWRTADTATPAGLDYFLAYERLRQDYLSHCDRTEAHGFWDAQEREAEADARYYRLATLWARVGVAAVLLGLTVLAVAHSPLSTHFFGSLP